MHNTDDFLFKEELDGWASVLPGLKIDYITTENLKRKDREKTLATILTSEHQQYYIAGPPGMVTSIVKFLTGQGIDMGNIKTDVFDGY